MKRKKKTVNSQTGGPYTVTHPYGRDLPNPPENAYGEAQGDGPIGGGTGDPFGRSAVHDEAPPNPYANWSKKRWWEKTLLDMHGQSVPVTRNTKYNRLAKTYAKQTKLDQSATSPGQSAESGIPASTNSTGGHPPEWFMPDKGVTGA